MLAPSERDTETMLLWVCNLSIFIFIITSPTAIWKEIHGKILDEEIFHVITDYCPISFDVNDLANVPRIS